MTRSASDCKIIAYDIGRNSLRCYFRPKWGGVGSNIAWITDMRVVLARGALPTAVGRRELWAAASILKGLPGGGQGDRRPSRLRRWLLTRCEVVKR